MDRYFVEYVDGQPYRMARTTDETPQESIDELIASGFTEVTEEEYNRCEAILFPPTPGPEPVTLEQVVQRVETVETEIDEAKRGILDLSMMMPAT